MIEDLSRIKDKELIAMIDSLMAELKLLDEKSATTRDLLHKYTVELTRRSNPIKVNIQGF